ncbi:MAG: hypothetical protein Q4D87_05680 [Actinomycetaceae bacterium]|nr:hypothetical protein [Actinomycetaceae bacterium]
MSTRSYVGVIEGNTISFIYVHFDGYLQGVGAALATGFPKAKDIKPIIALGDRSGLTLTSYAGDGDSYAEQGEVSDHLKPSTRTIAQGAKEETIKELITYAGQNGIEFLYLLDGKKWRAWSCFMEWAGKEHDLSTYCKAGFAWQITELARAWRKQQAPAPIPA